MGDNEVKKADEIKDERPNIEPDSVSKEARKIYDIVSQVNEILRINKLSSGEVFFVLGLIAADAILYTAAVDITKERLDTLAKVVDNNATCLNELQASFHKLFPPIKITKKDNNGTNQTPS